MKDQAVAEFIEGLGPTLRKQVEQIRKTILSASPTIEEGIKWNVPSFRTTFYLRAEWLGKERGMITFTGAKDVKAKQPALKRLIKEWITLL